MAATPMNPPTTLFGLNQERIKSMSDMIMAVLLITIIAMLIVPLPSWLLDTLLIINIATSVTVLMVSLYNNDPLEMSVFPSLLLVMTLYRLSLNVAATKLILGQGHAGAIIEAFGQFVIGGSYIVGIIAFLILIVVQFVVITNGAGRVAEVAARFTLDAMPGKQMAIDADLNAGLITEDQAKKGVGLSNAKPTSSVQWMELVNLCAVMLLPLFSSPLLTSLGGSPSAWHAGKTSLLPFKSTPSLPLVKV